MVAAAAANCELAGLHEQIRAWLADNGYASAANFAALEHLMLLVAVRNEAAQAGRADAAGVAARRLAEDGRPAGHPGRQKLYKRRAAQVEPAFAQLFARFGRYLSYRGRDAVDAEVKLLDAVHNMPSSWTTGAGSPPSPPDQAQPSAARQPARHPACPQIPPNPSGPARTAQPAGDQLAAHTHGYRQLRCATPGIASRTQAARRQTVALQPLHRHGWDIHAV